MQNKNIWVWIVVILVVVIGLIWWAKKAPVPTPTENTPVTLESTEDTSLGSVNAGTGAATISYANALVKYKNARLQLDANCQANPESQHMTFKNSAYMMVDNRAPTTRTVRIGSVFPIKAYGFKIVQLSSDKLPVTWLVDCDKSQNVATITIQK